jgi:hypothetical protein
MPPEAAEALKQAAQTKARIPETTPR